MKYLKCDHCAHSNLLKSEYLTFCEQCGKKMSNTFSDWRKDHPLACFEEYRQQVGISPKKIKKQVFRPWLQRQFAPTNRGKLILFFSIFTLLIATAGTLFGKRAVFTLFYAKVPKACLYSSWPTVTIGRQALEIATPVKLWIHDQPLEAEEAQITAYAKSYRNEDGSGIQIRVNMYSYVPNVANNLELAVTASHNKMQTEGEITDIQCKSVPVLISGLPGVLEEGNYLYKGAIRLAFRNLVVVRGVNRWQIHLDYRDDDEIGQQVAQRVLKSISIR
ncbi:hypothetical protein [Chitinophaga nivalis]|uniref:DUF4131 domain-containing protein n=1 Tax=Chitinophaga nivalis TaxID=2991709 RepID=A0ABT3IF03_9BACT|nr:hypothetical protein [Chitinophaga nivalis]MCW3467765.1 hypothetical protein [Chitinophaga nivalis]MCW3482543.1 hypothetical protein [Chitinophaga nivalis]